MKKNIGNTDRVIRLVLAALFAILFFTGTVTGTLGTVLLVLGAVFAGTAAIGTCPIYLIFGLSTCPAEPGKK